MTRAHEFGPPADTIVGRHPQNVAPFRQPEAESPQRREGVGNARKYQGDQWQLRFDRSKSGVERIKRQHHAGLANIQVVLDFRRGREGMNQRRQRAELVGGVKSDDALRRSRHRDQQPITCLQAHCRKRIGAGSDVIDKLAVGAGGVEKIPRDCFGHARGGCAQGLIQRELRIGKAMWHLAVKAQPGAVIDHV